MSLVSPENFTSPVDETSIEKVFPSFFGSGGSSSQYYEIISKGDSFGFILEDKSDKSERVAPSEMVFLDSPSERERSFEVRLRNVNFVPEPLKGKALNNYFKELNSTDENLYVMIQFEGSDGDPSLEELDILQREGIELFEYHGDHVYFAKTPKEFLETKSYDFIRWIGVVEDPLAKFAFVQEHLSPDSLDWFYGTEWMMLMEAQLLT